MNRFRNLAYKPLLLMLMLAITSCSNLKIEVAIYKEDPTYKGVMTKAELGPTDDYLRSVESTIDDILSQKTALADNLYDSYSIYWREEGRKYAKDNAITFDSIAEKNHMQALELKLNPQRESYKNTLISFSTEAKQYLKVAKIALQKLKDALPEHATDIDFTSANYLSEKAKTAILRKELKLALGDVDQSYLALVSLSDDPYQTSLSQRWNRIAKRVESEQFNSLFVSQSYSDSVKAAIKKASESILDVSNQVSTIISQSKISLEVAIEEGNLNNMLASLAENPMVYKLSAEEESKRLQAFDLLNSQLERLQNPGSPVWRVVTAPSNKKKCNTEFSRSYFYAEGNSGVVIVRDSPMEYRVQEATNNPAALVQAQLQISRAVADAAIQIAGASTGTPLVTTSFKQQAITKNDNSQFQADSESLAKRKAELESKEDLRALAKNAITANLESVLNQLKNLDPQKAADKEKIKALKKQLIVTLKAQSLHFSTKDDNS